MGIYWMIVNHTRKERLSPESFSAGQKIAEFTHSHKYFEAIFELLAPGQDGRWVGDRVEFVHDEGTDENQVFWEQCEGYTEISEWFL